MNKARYFAFTVMLLLCAAMLHARGGKEASPPVRIVQVTGVVRLIGTGLFPELVITSSEGDWYIAGDETGKLHELQQRTVTVEGEETEIEMRFASGLSAGTRRILKNIRVINIQ